MKKFIAGFIFSALLFDSRFLRIVTRSAVKTWMNESRREGDKS